jgi:hypothetical protein
MEQNKIYKNIHEYWHWGVFSAYLLALLSFLYIPAGAWLYDDLGWWPKNIEENLILLKQFLFSWDNSTSSFYGFDHYFIGFQKILSAPFIISLNFIFGSQFGEVFFYLILFLVAFVFSIKLFHSIKLNNYKMGALFYCFNPVSIYLIAQGTVFVSYCAIPIFLFSSIKLLEKIRAKYVLLNILSLMALTSYLRIFGIFLLFLSFIMCFYWKDVLLGLKKVDKKILALLMLAYVTCFLGLGLSVFFIYHDKITSQSNYITHQMALYGENFYEAYRDGSYINFISLNQIGANFGQSFIFINEILTLVLLWLLLFYFIKKNHKSRLDLSLFSILALTLSILFAGKLLTINAFLFLFSKILPFLYSNVLWVRLVLVLCLAGLIANITRPRILNVFLIGFSFIAILPLLFWPINPKLQKVSVGNPDYLPFSSNKNLQNTPAFFYPVNENVYSTLQVRGAPYPIDPTDNPQYHYLFSSNFRLVDDVQIKIETSLIDTPWNLRIFGLKDIFVFNNIPMFQPGIFDWYDANNYNQLASQYEQVFSAQSQLETVATTSTYTHYQLTDAANINFLLYVPRFIAEVELSTLETAIQSLNASQAPALISTNTGQSLANLATTSSQTAQLQFRYSNFDPTRYYLMLSNVKVDAPLVIQLNQTYNPRWKIYAVDGQTWNHARCVSNTIYYSLTQNSACEYQYSFLRYFDFSFFGSKRLINATHIQGNLIGNMFVIDPSQFQKLQNDGNLYFVIYFQKQDYYVLGLVTSAVVPTLILLGLVFEFLLVKFYLIDLFRANPKHDRIS